MKRKPPSRKRCKNTQGFKSIRKLPKISFLSPLHKKIDKYQLVDFFIQATGLVCHQRACALYGIAVRRMTLLPKRSMQGIHSTRSFHAVGRYDTVRDRFARKIDNQKTADTNTFRCRRFYSSIPSVSSSNVISKIFNILIILYNDGSTLSHSHSLTRCCVVCNLSANSF